MTESEVTFSARGKKPGETRRNQTADYRGAYGIYPPFPDACAPKRISKDPLLQFPEQPYENEKPEAYF